MAAPPQRSGAQCLSTAISQQVPPSQHVAPRLIVATSAEIAGTDKRGQQLLPSKLRQPRHYAIKKPLQFRNNSLARLPATFSDNQEDDVFAEIDGRRTMHADISLEGAVMLAQAIKRDFDDFLDEQAKVADDGKVGDLTCQESHNFHPVQKSQEPNADELGQQSKESRHHLGSKERERVNLTDSLVSYASRHSTVSKAMEEREGLPGVDFDDAEEELATFPDETPCDVPLVIVADGDVIGDSFWSHFTAIGFATCLILLILSLHPASTVTLATIIVQMSKQGVEWIALLHARLSELILIWYVRTTLFLSKEWSEIVDRLEDHETFLQEVSTSL